MAQLIPNRGSLAFRLDTGEMSGGKAVYKTVSLGYIRTDATAAALASIAEAFQLVLPWLPETITLRRNLTLEV